MEQSRTLLSKMFGSALSVLQASTPAINVSCKDTIGGGKNPQNGDARSNFVIYFLIGIFYQGRKDIIDRTDIRSSQ